MVDYLCKALCVCVCTLEHIHCHWGNGVHAVTVYARISFVFLVLHRLTFPSTILHCRTEVTFVRAAKYVSPVQGEVAHTPGPNGFQCEGCNGAMQRAGNQTRLMTSNNRVGRCCWLDEKVHCAVLMES